MIQMQRVRLINWHNFINTTVDFDQITYMVGVNAVGKTTILDAIRYCLTTEKKFNALGNKRSGRTLQGSVHGKQREGDGYTRPGHTISYVGIEFLNQQKGTKFVITVRVESDNPEQELRQVKQTWYISPENYTLDDLPFLDAETNQPSSREQFCLKKEKMPPIDRQNEARDKICRRLGIGAGESQLGKSFEAVFPMGTSLEEISDFKTFIYEYILPQPEINLEAMQQDEVELENLGDVLLNAQSRADQLKKIVEAGAEARKKERDVLLKQGVVLCAENDEKSGLEEQILSALEQCNLKIEQLEQEQRQAEQDASDAFTAYEQAIREAGESDIQKKLDGLKAYQKELKRELNEAQQRLSRFQTVCARIEGLQKDAVAYGFPLNEELTPANIQKMPERRQEELEANLIAELQRMERELDQQRGVLIAKNENKKVRFTELQKQIKVLSEGDLVYPDGNCAQIVKDAINQTLAAQGMEPDAKIVCDLLYMVDESWQSCVEACLGGRRFDIFVSPEHYKAAKNAFEKLGARVLKISLLDSRALERNVDKIPEPEQNMLASKVKSENRLVNAYVTDLLGNIVCCDTSDALENYPHSATRDLLRHYPYRLARLREPQKYIGQDARLEQLERAKQEAEEISQEMETLETRQKAMRALCMRFQGATNDSTRLALSAGWNSEKTYDACVVKYQNMTEEIQACENDPMLLASMRKQQLLKKDYDEKNEIVRSVNANLALSKNKAQNYQKQQEGAIEAAELARNAWQEFLKQTPALQEDIEKRYAEARKNNKQPQQIVRNHKIYQSQAERARDDFLESTLKPLQREYNQKYTCDFKLGMEGIDTYQHQYEQLVHIDLERYQSSLEKAKARCKERFRQDILFRLKDEIANARKQFRELNRIMEKLTYGEETYRFSIGPSENAQLGAFCRLIEHGSNQRVPEEGTLEAFAYQKDEAYEAQLDELMEHIMADLKIAAEERQKGNTVSSIELSSYVDYRQYLNCDIEITNAVTQKATKLSSVSGDSSGGENQAPFYIAICASLLQIYQKCQNSVRLILLDEAFSKMTSDRIRPMMKMFRDMDLQVVLITTVEKASAIAPFCDITHSILKKGTQNAVRPFYQDGE